jgi:hypothetical protein
MPQGNSAHKKVLVISFFMCPRPKASEKFKVSQTDFEARKG